MSIRKSGLAVFMTVSVLLPTSASSQEGSPAGPVPVEALQARRQAFLDALQGAPAVLFSAGPRGEYAQDSDYREDNDFFYLTGLEAPDGALTFNVNEPGGVSLYLPPRSPASERWTGPKLGPGPEAGRVTGFTDIRSAEALSRDLQDWLSPSGSRGASADTLFVNDLGPRFENVRLGLLPWGEVAPRPLSSVFAQLRVVKDEEELRRLRRAIGITSEAHRELWRVGAPGVAEYQLEATLEYVFRIGGAERVGFPSIVGSGPNGVVLHYDKNRRMAEAGELVVVDIGAEFGYYTADITRTFPVSGRFSGHCGNVSEVDGWGHERWVGRSPG